MWGDMLDDAHPENAGYMKLKREANPQCGTNTTPLDGSACAVIFTRVFQKNLFFKLTKSDLTTGANMFGELKGAGLFQRARRTKEQAAGRGTSRYPNGIKS